MRLLIFGGTQFVGRYITEAALAAGHEVTLFNRGRTNSDLFPQVEKIIGDRNQDLDLLRGREWDACIDVNAYVPRVVREALEVLQGAIGQYVFISTISVYADNSVPDQTEDAPLKTLDDPTTEAITPETYGGLKVLCEQAAQEIMGDRTLIIRPGFVVGPHDHTDRFPYWVRRAAQGGEMLAPASPDHPIQFIDARDLAAFTLRHTEAGTNDIFHVTGPKTPLTWGALLQTCIDVTGGDTRLTWVDEDFIKAHELVGLGLPMWATSEDSGLLRININKALQAGLTHRPLTETVHDTWVWDKSRPADVEHRFGLTLEREAELLQLWHEAQGT
ncbi:MAG: SDR family oxidoreductase [Chloroflexi bacterium]|nr:MAG: SDR family oxidoreductase [Chloroflexota bacterium]